MINNIIYGYGASLNHVFDDLDTSKSKISDLNVKLLTNLKITLASLKTL